MIVWLNGTYGVEKIKTEYKLNELYGGNSKGIEPAQL